MSMGYLTNLVTFDILYPAFYVIIHNVKCMFTLYTRSQPSRCSPRLIDVTGTQVKSAGRKQQLFSGILSQVQSLGNLKSENLPV